MPRKKPTAPVPSKPPRKKPVKRCERGHRMPSSWKAGEWCYQCAREDREAVRALGAVAEREAWQAKLGPPPQALTIRVVSTGKTLTYSIPKGLHGARPPLMRRRRGPRRRAGV